MKAENPDTAMADYAILLLTRKPRTYLELVPFVRLLNDSLTPESLHNDDGHINRLSKAGLITVEAGPPGRQEISQSVISITEDGIAHMRNRGFPLMPIGDTAAQNLPRPALS